VNILGELALWVALPVAAWGMVIGFTAGYRQRGDLALGAERAAYAVFGLVLLSSLGVISLFVQNRFDYKYVFNYSSSDLQTYFKVSGLWAGQTGSLLFWLLIFSSFTAICVWTNRTKNREFMPYVVGVLLSIATFFLVVLLFAGVNPYERLGYTPVDGFGLNPQLQNYWMTIHPPTLYLGFTAFSIPFAFGMAALMSGRLDVRWLIVTRKWTLLSWFFLSNGIVFGMRWAYEELGWGGYWFWDPVENASLLPWLSATAFLHSIQIQEKRGMLKVWNMSLVILTFTLTIFATFLTRSGLIESVHTFAENTKIAFIFLAFLAVIVSAGIVLILARLPKLKSENQIESFLSRESAFLFNNLILLGSAFAVLWGTLLPLLSEGFFENKITVGPPFFNRVNLPIGLVLLALVGIGPVIAWRKASKRNLVRNFAKPVAVAVATIIALLAGGMSLRTPTGEWSQNAFMAMLTFAIAAFVMTTIVTEFWKGTKARARIEGEGFATAFSHLIMRNRRRWGGYVVHVGMVLIFVAFAGNAWKVRVVQTLAPGETAEIESALGATFGFTYEGMSTTLGKPGEPNSRNLDWEADALFTVSKDGEPLGQLHSRRRRYIRPEDTFTSEVGIKVRPLEDLYVILSDAEDLEGVFRGTATSQKATFEFQVNPLVVWIWAGTLVLTIGGLIAMWPEAPRIREESLSGESKEPARTGLAAD
jgi:cytochrome c-type biogenesis protein CcmF